MFSLRAFSSSNLRSLIAVLLSVLLRLISSEGYQERQRDCRVCVVHANAMTCHAVLCYIVLRCALSAIAHSYARVPIPILIQTIKLSVFRYCVLF